MLVALTEEGAIIVGLTDDNVEHLKAGEGIDAPIEICACIDRVMIIQAADRDALVERVRGMCAGPLPEPIEVGGPTAH